jgi:hypothetical protein
MKQKIDFSEIVKLGYYNFANGVCRHRRGYYYWFDKISEEMKAEYLLKYNNIVFLNSRKQYAPEIKSKVIFVADTPFDAEFEKLRVSNCSFVARIFNGCKMYSVTSLDCKENNTRYFHTKKDAAKYIRDNFAGLEKAIRLNDLRCA